MSGLPHHPRDDKWRCKICQFDNVQGLTSCEICESPKSKQLKKDENLKERQIQLKEPGIICPNKACCHYNHLFADICSKCNKSLFGEENYLKVEKHPQKTKMKYCYTCAFENHPSNKTCVNCDINLAQKVIPNISIMPGFGAKSHSKKLSAQDFYCEDCGGKVELLDPNRRAMGYPVSYTDYVCNKCSRLSISSGKLCVFCDQKLSAEEIQFHNDICESRAKFFKNEGNPTFDRCSKLQVDAISYMHKKCQQLHQKNKYLLIHRIKKLGYSQNDLENLHHYIMHYAPIIIHMRVTNFQYFTNDTHYRNCFEVAKRNVPSRVQWEDRMFDNKHHRASFFERVKYGTMNFTNDPKGVNACVGYGQSYFLLKPHVRDRCTITDMDSASPSATIGTFRFVFHVMMKLSDAQLKAAFEGSKAKEMLSNVIGMYKEIQIHGPVQFSKDIERVYLCRQQFASDNGSLQKLATQFCQKNKIQHEFFDRKAQGFAFGGHPGKIKVQKAPQRIVGKDNKLKQTRQKKPAAAHPHLWPFPAYQDPYGYEDGYFQEDGFEGQEYYYE